MRTHNDQFLKQYHIGTVGSVYALLNNIHRLRESRLSRTDFNASVILMDFDLAYDTAELTEKQKQALHYVYEKDLTQSDTSKYMNCTQQAVQQHIKRAVKKIAEVCGGGDDID